MARKKNIWRMGHQLATLPARPGAELARGAAKGVEAAAPIITAAGDSIIDGAGAALGEVGGGMGRAAGTAAQPLLQGAIQSIGQPAAAGMGTFGGGLGGLLGSVIPGYGNAAGAAAGSALGAGLGQAINGGMSTLAAAAPELGAQLGKAAATPLAKAALRVPIGAASKGLRGLASAGGSYGEAGEDDAAHRRTMASIIPKFQAPGAADASALQKAILGAKPSAELANDAIGNALKNVKKPEAPEMEITAPQRSLARDGDSDFVGPPRPPPEKLHDGGPVKSPGMRLEPEIAAAIPDLRTSGYGKKPPLVQRPRPPELPEPGADPSGPRFLRAMGRIPRTQQDDYNPLSQNPPAPPQMFDGGPIPHETTQFRSGPPALSADATLEAIKRRRGG